MSNEDSKTHRKEKKCSLTELYKSKSDNAEIEETKKRFNELWRPNIKKIGKSFTK